MQMIKKLLCLGAVLFVVGCSTASTKKATNPARTTYAIQADDSGTSLSTKVGDSIVFTAKENPSTGYVWSAQFDEAVLAEDKTSYTSSVPANSEIVGAPGTRTMGFRVKSAGKTTLSLSLIGPGANGSVAEKVDVAVEAQ